MLATEPWTTRVAKRSRASAITVRVRGQRLCPDVVVVPTDALRLLCICEEHVYIGAGLANAVDPGGGDDDRQWVIATRIALDAWPNDASLCPARFGAPRPHDVDVVFEAM